MNLMSTSPQEQEAKEIFKLININKDAAEFYSSAQKKVESIKLKNTFKDLEQLHESTITRLKSIVAQKSNEAYKKTAEETIMGTTKRLFGELAAELSGNPNATLIKRLEEAEDRCLHSMEEVMNENKTTAQTRGLLQIELQKLQKSHDHMKFLKDTIAA